MSTSPNDFIEIGKRIDALYVDHEANIYYHVDEEFGLWMIRKDSTVDYLARSYDRFRGITRNGTHLVLTAPYENALYSYSFKLNRLEFFAGSMHKAKGHRNGLRSVCSFTQPWGITVDAMGNIYITEDHMIRKLSKLETETLCGSSSGHEDGNLSEAQFYHPSGITASKDGTLYVADSHNHCIRKISNGQVSTIAGKPGRRGHKDGSLSDALFSHPQSMALVGGVFLFVTDDVGIRKIVLGQNTVGTIRGNFRHLATDQHGLLYASTLTGIQKFNVMWEIERLLWIGNQKEDSQNCCWSLLPRDIVREIVAYLKFNLMQEWA